MTIAEHISYVQQRDQLIDLLYSSSDEEDICDSLYRNVDEWLRAGEFAHADILLLCLDLSRVSTAAMVGCLSITSAAKERIPDRVVFFDRVVRELINRGEAPHEMLKGLL